MSQEYAPLMRSIWQDPDFRALGVDEQLLYLMLLSHPDRNAAGVLSLTPRKWALLSKDWTADRLLAAALLLDGNSFLVMDQETEEVLVRAFIRRAKVYAHIRLLRQALRQVAEVESDRIRSALGQELVRLPRLEIPTPRGDKNAQSIKEAREAQVELDELASMFCDAPPDGPGHGAVDPMAHPMAQGMETAGRHPMAHPMGHPTGVGTGTGEGVGTGSVGGFSSLTSRSNSSVSNAGARLTGLCPSHPGEPARGCRGCAADIKAAR